MLRVFRICFFGFTPAAIGAANTADVVCHSGDISTVDDKNPTAEAVP